MKEAKLVARFVRGSKGGNCSAISDILVPRAAWLSLRRLSGPSGSGDENELVTATQFPPFNFFTLSLFEYISKK